MTAITKQLSRSVRWSTGLLLVVWTLGIWACAAHCAGLLEPAAGAHAGSCCQQAGTTPSAADSHGNAGATPPSGAGGNCDGIRCHGDDAILSPATASTSPGWEPLSGWLPLALLERQLPLAIPDSPRAPVFAPPDVRPPLPASWPPHWGLPPPAYLA